MDIDKNPFYNVIEQKEQLKKAVYLTLHRQQNGGRLVELEAVDPYSGSYEATLDRAERELDSNARPALATVIDQMESYDFTGKTIVPFCTSGSSGISTSMGTIGGLCPNSTVLQGIRVGSASEIEPWLEQIGF